jgi:hypothetical protein
MSFIAESNEDSTEEWNPSSVSPYSFAYFTPCSTGKTSKSIRYDLKRKHYYSAACTGSQNYPVRHPWDLRSEIKAARVYLFWSNVKDIRPINDSVRSISAGRNSRRAYIGSTLSAPRSSLARYFPGRSVQVMCTSCRWPGRKGLR